MELRLNDLLLKISKISIVMISINVHFVLSFTEKHYILSFIAIVNPLYKEKIGFHPSACNFSVLNIARFIAEYPLLSAEEGRS